MVSQPCALEPSAYFLAVEREAWYDVYLFQKLVSPFTGCGKAGACLESSVSACPVRGRARSLPRSRRGKPWSPGLREGMRLPQFQAGHFGSGTLSVSCLPPLWFPGPRGAFHSKVLWIHYGDGGDAPGIRPCCRRAWAEEKVLMWGQMNRADA